MSKNTEMEYNFEDIMELRRKQNKEISKKLDAGLNKFMKEFFKKNTTANRVVFDQDWASNDEGGSDCYVIATVWDKDDEELDELSLFVADILNILPKDLCEEVGGEYFRSPAVKAKYESR